MLLLMCMFVLIWSFERLKSDPLDFPFKLSYQIARVVCNTKTGKQDSLCLALTAYWSFFWISLESLCQCDDMMKVGRDLMPGGRYDWLSLFTLHNNNGLKTSLYGETKFFINGCSSRTVKHAAIWVNNCFSTRKCLHDSDWLNLGQDVTWNPAGEQHKPIRHRSSSHQQHPLPSTQTNMSLEDNVAIGKVRGMVPVKFPPQVFTGNSCSVSMPSDWVTQTSSV